MGFPSLSSGASGRKCAIRLGLDALALIAVLTPAFAVAGGPPAAAAPAAAPNPPSIEFSKVVLETDAKRLAKYDVSRIGQRDIGKGFNLYSMKKEQELGRSIAAGLDHNTKLIKDSVVNDYINRLAQKLVANSDAEVPFTVKVIDGGDIPRAYGLPGGFLYVDSALITSADSEAELATVIAHEIGHVAARHATRALSRKHVYSIANSLAMFAGPVGMAVEDAGGIAGPLSVKKFARESECEADLLGVEYAYAAGYDPQSLMDALEKLHAIEAHRRDELKKVPGYHLASMVPFHSKIARGFADYPMVEERIQKLLSEIPSFLPNRRDYIIDTDDFQEVKTRLLSYATPVLRHHDAGDDKENRPTLRRTADSDTDLDMPPENETAQKLVGTVAAFTNDSRTGRLQ